MPPLHVICTPAQASSIAFVGGALSVGSDDGTVRLYQPPYTRVSQAIRGLGGSVSSIVFSESKSQEVWIACEHEILGFPLDSSKLILSRDQASKIYQVGRDADDVLNEICAHENGSQIAYSSDSGQVGVIELSTGKILRMATTHENICGVIKFIPNRPSEIVSGGYDHRLLHFDSRQAQGILSQISFSGLPPSTGISLSPPFILSISVSSTGVIAAGLADGRVWIGTGAQRAKEKKKRTRKWEGLSSSNGGFHSIAEGPIVGLAFVSSLHLACSTLLGRLSVYSLVSSPEGNKNDLTDLSGVRLEAVWNAQTVQTSKVNALAYNAQDRILGVAGIQGESGCVELWELPQYADIESSNV